MSNYNDNNYSSTGGSGYGDDNLNQSSGYVRLPFEQLSPYDWSNDQADRFVGLLWPW